MKKYFNTLTFVLFLASTPSAFAARTELPTECRKALEIVFQDIGMTIEDLDNPSKIRAFKNQYRNTTIWKTLAAKCAQEPIPSDSSYFHACPCAGYGLCFPWAGDCFWNCESC